MTPALNCFQQCPVRRTVVGVPSVHGAKLLQGNVRPAISSSNRMEIVPRSSQPDGFNTATYDRERLALDAEARKQMTEEAEAVSQVEAEAPGSVRGAWKWDIRKQIWDMLEANDVSNFPRPVHHRIPNFKGADRAAATLAELDEFQQAKCIKVNPDTPQKQVRFATLSSGKALLTPQPRLRTGFFSTLHRDHIPQEALLEACTSAGVQKFGKPLSLDDKIKVDMIVVGSVAVCKNGARLGKGEGFAELEYGMLRYMGAIDEHTLVVTTVRDEQVIDDIPPERMLEHDVPVDIIVTHSGKVIRTNTSIPKPPGILWDKLSPEKLSQIKILQQLKQRIERETGVALPTGPSETLPPLAERRRPPSSGRKGRQGKGQARGGR